jgi:hypothetical protein
MPTMFFFVNEGWFCGRARWPAPPAVSYVRLLPTSSCCVPCACAVPDTGSARPHPPRTSSALWTETGAGPRQRAAGFVPVPGPYRGGERIMYPYPLPYHIRPLRRPALCRKLWVSGACRHPLSRPLFSRPPLPPPPPLLPVRVHASPACAARTAQPRIPPLLGCVACVGASRAISGTSFVWLPWVRGCLLCQGCPRGSGPAGGAQTRARRDRAADP